MRPSYGIYLIPICYITLCYIPLFYHYTQVLDIILMEKCLRPRTGQGQPSMQIDVQKSTFFQFMVMYIYTVGICRPRSVQRQRCGFLFVVTLLRQM